MLKYNLFLIQNKSDFIKFKEHMPGRFRLSGCKYNQDLFTYKEFTEVFTHKSINIIHHFDL